MPRGSWQWAAASSPYPTPHPPSKLPVFISSITELPAVLLMRLRRVLITRAEQTLGEVYIRAFKLQTAVANTRTTSGRHLATQQSDSRRPPRAPSDVDACGIFFRRFLRRGKRVLRGRRASRKFTKSPASSCKCNSFGRKVISPRATPPNRGRSISHGPLSLIAKSSATHSHQIKCRKSTRRLLTTLIISRHFWRTGPQRSFAFVLNLSVWRPRIIIQLLWCSCPILGRMLKVAERRSPCRRAGEMEESRN